MDVGYFYCPYVDLDWKPQPVEFEEPFDPTKSILTRYGKKLLAMQKEKENEEQPKYPLEEPDLSSGVSLKTLEN